MKVTSKQVLITLAVIVVIMVIVGFWFYRKGKKQTTIAPLPVDNPAQGGGGTAGGGSSTGTATSMVSSAEIAKAENDLFRELDGLGIWRDPKPYQKILEFSDTDFVRVYNLFNTNHQDKGKGTLKQWLKDEFLIGEVNTLRESIFSRMARLNLI